MLSMIGGCNKCAGDAISFSRIFFLKIKNKFKINVCFKLCRGYCMLHEFEMISRNFRCKENVYKLFRKYASLKKFKFLTSSRINFFFHFSHQKGCFKSESSNN